jgi:hypothetical protein
LPASASSSSSSPWYASQISTTRRPAATSLPLFAVRSAPPLPSDICPLVCPCGVCAAVWAVEGLVHAADLQRLYWRHHTVRGPTNPSPSTRITRHKSLTANANSILPGRFSSPARLRAGRLALC